MEIPKVKFIYAYPLDVDRRKLYSSRELGHYPSVEEIKEKIIYWEALWNKTNEDDRVILKLIELTKRTPKRSLECFVLGGGINPMSAPFIMPLIRKPSEMYSDDQFIEILIHEIMHIFLAGNHRYFDAIRQKYEKETVSVCNHIIIYALLEKIYLDIFRSTPVHFYAKDMPKDYERAAEIVKEGGYENFIKEYQELAIQ